MTVNHFYKTEEEFNQLYTGLKMLNCPHCHLCGCLILHGYLYGYQDSLMTKIIKRGRRIFCSNRKKRKGCGRTFSILLPDVIKNFIISAKALWCFLNNVKDGMCLKKAFEVSNSHLTQTSIYRLFKKFKYQQVSIRSCLMRIKDPPNASHIKDPVLLTILHLKSAFPVNFCPVSQFQLHFQTSFF